MQDYGDDDETIKLEPEYAYYDNRFGILDEIVSVGAQEDENTTKINSTVQEKRRNNNTNMADVNNKEQNQTSSSYIRKITQNEKDHANTRNSSNKEKDFDVKELDRNATHNKALTQPMAVKGRKRRDVSAETTGQQEESRVILARQAKADDTVYDWSVDELSESEKWQVDRVDPGRKTFLERAIQAFTFLKKYPSVTTPIIVVVATILGYCCCCCCTPCLVLCCCDPRNVGRKSAEQYLVGLRKDSRGNYVIEDITDYEREAAGRAADIY